MNRFLKLPVVALAFLLFAPYFPSVALVPVANAVSAAPTIGIQTAENTGAGGCNDKFSNMQYSGDGSFTVPPGNTDCIRIYLSAIGAFSQDFQIGIRMQRKPDLAPQGWGPWTWTNWATDPSSLGYSDYSPWVGALVNVGSDPGYANYQIAVNTRPLPAGELISDVSVGIQNGDYNSPDATYNPGYACDQPPHEQDGTVDTFGAGWSGWTSASDVADCSRLFLHAEAFNAQPLSDNVPNKFSVGQSKTVGVDANPIGIFMKSTGPSELWGTAWSDNLVAPAVGMGAPVGTCDATGPSNFSVPSLGDPVGSQCSGWYTFSSNQMVLQHSGSFVVNPVSPSYTHNEQVTVTTKNDGYFDTSGCDWFSDPSCTGVWTQTVDYAYAYNDPNNVSGGGGVPFYITSMQAPASPGTYTETWTLNNTGCAILQGPCSLGTFGVPFTKSITVTAGASPDLTAAWGDGTQSTTMTVTAGQVVSVPFYYWNSGQGGTSLTNFTCPPNGVGSPNANCPNGTLVAP